MFLLRGTTDQDRSRSATGTAAQALRQHDRMTREGLDPAVTDHRGRPLSLADLRRLVQAERGPHLS